MFERYTERAKRVLFFARYEAIEIGSPTIETEHILLGLIREGRGRACRILASLEEWPLGLRREIEARTVTREKDPRAPIHIPFSAEVTRVLPFAELEADGLGNEQIGTEHLLFAMLHEERSVAASILIENGLDLRTARKAFVN